MVIISALPTHEPEQELNEALQKLIARSICLASRSWLKEIPAEVCHDSRKETRLRAAAGFLFSIQHDWSSTVNLLSHVSPCVGVRGTGGPAKALLHPHTQMSWLSLWSPPSGPSTNPCLQEHLAPTLLVKRKRRKLNRPGKSDITL